jgi:hypothetical protein
VVAENDGPGRSQAVEEYHLIAQFAHGEIIFLKGQQWLITNYGLLLYGALVGICALLESPMSSTERCVLAILAAIASVVSIVMVWKLYADISEARSRSRLACQNFSIGQAFPELTKERPFAGVDVSAMLTGVLIVGVSLTVWLLLWKL